MLALAIMLVAAMLIIEITFVHAFPRFGKWVAHHPARSLIFSLIVSVLLGKLFPAAGLIVMIGGLFSTVAIRPYYWYMDLTERHHVKRAARKVKISQATARMKSKASPVLSSFATMNEFRKQASKR